MLNSMQILFILVLMSFSLSFSQSSDTLSVSDFSVGQLNIGADSINVLKIIGNPKSISLQDNPYEKGTRLIDWHYDDLKLEMHLGNYLSSIILLTNRYSTARGLQVGDSINKVYKLYGVTSYGRKVRMQNNILEYFYNNLSSKSIQIVTNGKVVKYIRVGLWYE